MLTPKVLAHCPCKMFSSIWKHVFETLEVLETALYGGFIVVILMLCRQVLRIPENSCKTYL
jgi:hypothetical protein